MTTAAHTLPLPRWIPTDWVPTYEMNRSISLYWRNETGIEPAEFYDGYGVVIFDWAHGAQQWINEYTPMDNGAVLAKQCSVIKARNPHIKCNVYRNNVIALNQFRHISKILDDPAFAGYFLRFKAGATQSGKCWAVHDPRAVPGTGEDSFVDPKWPTPVICANLTTSDVHVPMCDKAEPSKCNRKQYFDQHQCPQVPGHNWANDTKDVYQGLICKGSTCNCGNSPCGEFLFDFTNASLVDWWLHEHMGGATALAHPDVDGLILDDQWGRGPSEIESHSVDDMGLTSNDTKNMHKAYETAMGRLLAYIASRNKFLAGGRNRGYFGDSMSIHNASTCASKMTAMCAAAPTFGQWYVVNYEYIDPPDYGVRPTNAVLDVAYFLSTRAPFAWIAGGHMLGWHMSHWWAANKTRRINFRTDLRPSEFNDDYGVPTGNCTQLEQGVFTRRWSKANVTVNCNTLQGEIASL